MRSIDVALEALDAVVELLGAADVRELFTVTVNPSPRGRYFRPQFIDCQPKWKSI